MKTIASILCKTGLLLASSATYAHDADPYHDGWVSHVSDRQVEICYQHSSPPTVGKSVQILAPSYISPKQGLVYQRFTRSGAARVTSSGSDGCVLAELIDGSARRSYHARTAS